MSFGSHLLLSQAGTLWFYSSYPSGHRSFSPSRSRSSVTARNPCSYQQSSLHPHHEQSEIRRFGNKCRCSRSLWVHLQAGRWLRWGGTGSMRWVCWFRRWRARGDERFHNCLSCRRPPGEFACYWQFISRCLFFCCVTKTCRFLSTLSRSGSYRSKHSR